MTVLPIIRSSILGAGSGGSGGPKANGAITLGPQSSAYLPGASGSDSYFTIPTGAGLIYPAGDWADIFCIKIQNVNASFTQHLFNNGTFGSGQGVFGYITSTSMNLRINNGATQTVTDAGASFVSSLGNNAGWYYVALRKIGSNLEISIAPKGGAAATKISTLIASNPANTITPNASVLTIGTRSDHGANTQIRNNNVAYYARVNGTFTDAMLTSLAAGQDIVSDLGFAPLVYVKFNTNAATVPDVSGNSRPATKVGNPRLRGGPSFSGQAVTIDRSFDNWWGRVFQRDTHGFSVNITPTGTYSGKPGGIMVRVIDNAGNQISAPVAATYPSSGVWSATLTVPQGAQYTLEAYWSNDATKIARSQMHWGVGMIAAILGESLADQQAASSFSDGVIAPVFEELSVYDQPDSWVVSATYATGNVRQDPVDYTIWKLNLAGNGQTSGTGTFAADRLAHPTFWTQLDPYTQVTDFLNAPNAIAIQTISRLRDALGIPVMAGIGAKTGSQLVGGSPNNWATYTDPVTHGKVKGMLANVGGDAELIIWQQGANDANSSSPPSAAAYQAAWQALMPQLRSYFTLRSAANLPIFSGICGSNALNNSAVDAGWRAVRSGTIAAIPLVTNAFECGGLWDLTHSGNGLHPDVTATGYWRLAKRQAQAPLHYYLPLAYPNGVKGSVIASAAALANAINVTVTLANGTALQGLINNTAVLGFVVKNASAVAQTINSTSISGNVITLNFTGVPGTGWTVDYIPTEFPDPSNLLYDNGSVIGDTAGIPVLPLDAPITLP